MCKKSLILGNCNVRTVLILLLILLKFGKNGHCVFVRRPPFPWPRHPVDVLVNLDLVIVVYVEFDVGQGRVLCPDDLGNRRVKWMSQET
jgi:hypothetical protein